MGTHRIPRVQDEKNHSQTGSKSSFNFLNFPERFLTTNKQSTKMEFQAAPIEHMPMDASMDVQMDAAMNAAKEAAMAVDELVQQLSTSAEGMQAELEEQIVENVANNDSVFAEPVVEEIVEQVQQTSGFPFFLVASTLILGFVIFVVIFLRRRRAAKSEVAPVATETLVAAETEVAEAKCEVEAAPAA